MSRSGFNVPGVIRCTVVLLLVEALWSHTAFALDPKKGITQYVHDVWQMKDGLPSNNVGAILQTRDGYLWFGTEGGLARFDGARLTLFNQTEATKNYGARALYEDRSGNLWIGTAGGGLVKYQDGRFTTYTTKDGLAEDRVGAICEDRDGNLWISTQSGLSRFTNGAFTNYQAIGGPIVEDRAGTLWLGGSGLTRMKDGKFTAFTVTDGLSDSTVNSVYEDRAGNLWIGTRRGLNRWVDGRFIRYTMKDGFPEDRVMAIYEDRAGNLWIGTFGSGLGRFRDGKFTSFTSRDGLSDDRVVSIYEDREGDLWVGTYSGGVDRFRDGKVTAYTTKEGLGEDWTYAVYEDRAGSLWIGTKNGLTRFRISGFGFLKASPIRNLQSAIRNQGVRSIYEDRTGNLWIGTQGGGLYRFKDGKFTSYTIKDSQNDVRCIDQDRQGRLWIGGVIGRVGALVRFSEGRLVEYPMKDRISGLVYSILEDRSGHLWVGTNRGLVRLRDEEFTRYTTKDGLSSLNAMSLHEDREGVLWIGTYGGGLNRFKDGKFTSVTMGQGLFDNVVYRILEDDRGNFWMSGNKGIFSVSKKELNDCAEGKVKTITSIAFSTADGMKAIECAGAHQPAGWKTRDGKLWFPTTKGVVMIDPANIPTNMVPPPVYVERVLVDEQAIDLSQQAELPPGREKFEFHYTALSFLDPGRVKFKYLLEGFDKNWVDAGTRRVAYYTNLPPGPHRFRVRACNNDGVWNDAGAAVEFYLKPHFYQTGVFYALSALVLVLLGPSIYLLRVRQLRAREKALERLVDERTRELAELNRTLEQRVREGVKALTEAERMAAYGQLVTGVAHEVRNPLFALQTAAYVIQMQCGQVCQREGVQPQLGVLERETKRLADLMSELLEFARPRSLLLAPTDLKSLLDEAVEMYRAGHDAAFPKIVVGSNSTALQVVVDRGRVVQVLVNLIENAVKHAKGLTTVTLSVDGATGPRACIRVHDDGAGIAPDHLPHIFEPFFTTGKGTGLGLAIVQRIIKEHGGTIEVESEVGRGTVFTICLPISTAEIAENAEI